MKHAGLFILSLTGSCSKKEGISFVFIKYSNVNAILFVLLKCQCWYKKYQLCVCQILKCLWGFFSRAHVCEAEIYPFFFGWNEPCQMRQEMISSSRSQSGEWGELLVPAAWHTLFVQGSPLVRRRLSGASKYEGVFSWWKNLGLSTVACFVVIW